MTKWQRERVRELELEKIMEMTEELKIEFKDEEDFAKFKYAIENNYRIRKDTLYSFEEKVAELRTKDLTISEDGTTVSVDLKKAVKSEA